MIRTVAILTISDRAASGQYEDTSGPLIADIIRRRTDWAVVYQQVIGDDQDSIANALIKWCDEGIDLLLTTGGTGLAPRDVTPEATLQVLERQTPGIVEALRAESLKLTRHAMLSRAVAGIRAKTLIINLPGSPKAVKENLDTLMPVLPHALDLLKDDTGAEKGHRSV